MRSNRTLERHFCSSTLTAFLGKEKCQSACLPLCVAPQFAIAPLSSAKHVGGWFNLNSRSGANAQAIPHARDNVTSPDA